IPLYDLLPADPQNAIPANPKIAAPIPPKNLIIIGEIA
ncbi:unnamed protein product, partial [marine sediment metagenome]